MVLVNCIVLLFSNTRIVVIAIFLELHAFSVGDFRNNWWVAVRLICADDLISLKDKTGDIHVRVILYCLNNFVAMSLVEGVKQDPLSSR